MSTNQKVLAYLNMLVYKKGHLHCVLYLATEAVTLLDTGRPRLTNVRPTNIRTYEQAADVHSPGPANICSHYEHRFRTPNTRLTNGNLERSPFVSWGPLYQKREREEKVVHIPLVEKYCFTGPSSEPLPVPENYSFFFTWGAYVDECIQHPRADCNSEGCGEKTGWLQFWR
jgi:hypothetical protein